jgi:DNA-binding transcriptional LysR family regulator
VWSRPRQATVSTGAPSDARARAAAARRGRRRAEGPLRGQLALGASTGPGGTVVPVLLCEFAEANPEITVDLTISDTQTIVEQVARRELELGVVGATPRNRAVAYEPFFRDEVILVCPPDHPFAARRSSSTSCGTRA